MSNFKSQVELSKHAYEQTNGNKEQMIEMVAQLLAENPTLLKESKRHELDNKGHKGYVSYAKVKVREYFTRTLKQTPKVETAPQLVETKVENETMASFCPNPDANANGTSLQGHITCSFQDLVKAFGSPLKSDGYKVSGEWFFSDNNGNTFTIYDWKSTALYDENLPSVEEFRATNRCQFNVGGSTDATDFIKWVKTATSSSQFLSIV